MSRDTGSGSSAPRLFWRVAPAKPQDADEMLLQSSLVGVPELFAKIRPRHGLVLASWDAGMQLGRVAALGVVKSVEPAALRADVLWRRAEIELRPNPSGRTFWANRPFFRFADDVAVRYMLADLFAEHFPEFGALAFSQAPAGVSPLAPASAAGSSGYVYVIRSPYGFKIGKTINLKGRTRLFEVKLPFPITVEHYAWFDDYTAAEREFHRMFHHLRLEGEWFDLGPKELTEIRRHGKTVVT